jgi:hypothetical protein
MGSQDAEPKGPGGATPLLYARLNDAGDAFEPQRNLITFATGLDGGGSVTADPDSDQVAIAWHAPRVGQKGEENRSVFYAYSTDGGKTFERERDALYKTTGTCGCCGMRAILMPGTLYFLYRGVGEDARSMLLGGMITALDAGIGTQELDPWPTKTCPMSTASLARSGDRLLGAWETDGQVRWAIVATPPDGVVGRPKLISAPGTGRNRKHPTLAVDKAGHVLLGWSEGTGWKKGGSVAWQVFGTDLQPIAGANGTAENLPIWSLPTAVATGEGSFLLVY